MCEVTTLLAIGSTFVGAVGKRNAAENQVDALNRQGRIQADEINDANSSRLGERVKQGRAERARLRVAAGEAGVAGQSFEAQLMDSAFQESEDVATIKKDTKLQQRASGARTASAVAGVSSPSFLATGLQIAGSGFAAHERAKSLEIPGTG